MCVNAATRCNERARDSGQVLERVKLRLIGKPQRIAYVETRQWRAGGQTHIQPCPLCGSEFIVEHVGGVIPTTKQVTIESGKRTLDSLLIHDRLYPIDCCRMTLGSKARGIHAVHSFEYAVSVIQSVAQVRGGTGGLASPDRTAALEHNDIAARTR
jgi:hypothetical protein